MHDFDRELKAAVKRAGSIAEVARQLGAPYRTIQDWTLGTRRPVQWQAPIFAEALKKIRSSP